MGHIGSFLRIAQASLYLVTLGSGITCCICMASTSKHLGGQCVLFSNTVFNPPQNNTITLDLTKTTWGSASVCSYCTFSAVMAVIYAIIWFWFYILMSDWKGGLRLQHYFLAMEDGPPPDVKLLIPTLICNLSMFCCMAVSTVLITGGFKTWCESVEASFPGQDCSVLEQYTWSYADAGKDVYSSLKEAHVSCWVTLVALGSKMVLASIRLRRYVTSVKKLEKMVDELNEESILKTISEESDDDQQDDLPTSSMSVS